MVSSCSPAGSPASSASCSRTAASARPPRAWPGGGRSLPIASTPRSIASASTARTTTSMPWSISPPATTCRWSPPIASASSARRTSRRTRRGFASTRDEISPIPAGRARTPPRSICAAPRRWRRCSPICPRRSRTASRSPGAAASSSSSTGTSCPPSRCRPGPAPRPGSRARRAPVSSGVWPRWSRSAVSRRRAASTTSAWRWSSASSPAWATRGTISSSPTSYAGRASRAYPSAPGGARGRGRWSPSRSASRIWIRSASISCSSGS